MRNKIKREAVSPVIATVIIVAVAITVAVAISYWMGGISSQYTKFEKVEIQSGTCVVDANGNWTISLKLKNTGTETATLLHIFINNVEIDNYDNGSLVGGEWNTDMTDSFSLTSGQSALVNMYISSFHPPQTLSAGTSINIRLHSAGGMDYIKMIELV